MRLSPTPELKVRQCNKPVLMPVRVEDSQCNQWSNDALGAQGIQMSIPGPEAVTMTCVQYFRAIGFFLVSDFVRESLSGFTSKNRSCSHRATAASLQRRSLGICRSRARPTTWSILCLAGNRHEAQPAEAYRATEGAPGSKGHGGGWLKDEDKGRHHLDLAISVEHRVPVRWDHQRITWSYNATDGVWSTGKCICWRKH